MSSFLSSVALNIYSWLASPFVEDDIETPNSNENQAWNDNIQKKVTQLSQAMRAEEATCTLEDLKSKKFVVFVKQCETFAGLFKHLSKVAEESKDPNFEAWIASHLNHINKIQILKECCKGCKSKTLSFNDELALALKNYEDFIIKEIKKYTGNDKYREVLSYLNYYWSLIAKSASPSFPDEQKSGFFILFPSDLKGTKSLSLEYPANIEIAYEQNRKWSLRVKSSPVILDPLFDKKTLNDEVIVPFYEGLKLKLPIQYLR